MGPKCRKLALHQFTEGLSAQISAKAACSESMNFRGMRGIFMAEVWPIVLVYSDNEPLGHALRFVLHIEEVEVQLCPDAGALLSSQALLRTHCLVLKDHPPLLDGCMLSREARSMGARAPTILLVDAATAQVRARAAAAQIWLVLEKPVLDNSLIEAIMSCLPERGLPKPTYNPLGIKPDTRAVHPALPKHTRFAHGSSGDVGHDDASFRDARKIGDAAGGD